MSWSDKLFYGESEKEVEKKGRKKVEDNREKKKTAKRKWKAR